MQAIFFGLISYFSWGIGDVFATITARKLESFSTTFWRSFLGVLIFSLYIPFALQSLKNITLQLLFFNFVLGIIGSIGLVAFYEGLKRANPALTGTVGNTYPFLAVILSLVFFKERLNVPQILTIIIILSGIILSATQIKEFKRIELTPGIIWSILASGCFGLYYAFIKIPVSQIGWFWPSYFSLFISAAAMFLFIKFKNMKFYNSNFRTALIPLVIFSILWTLGEFSYNFAIGKGLISIISPIAGASPTLFVILAFLVFKDKITKQQIAGIIVTLFGIVLLSILSV